MAEDAKPRPVSGEIMAGAVRRDGAERQDDIVDAEFVSLPAGRREPRHADMARVPAPPAQGMETLVAPAKTAGASRGGPLFWAGGLALAACAFWVSGGHALVRAPEPTVEAAPGPAAALRITDVAHRVVERGGRPVLQVDGAALNESEYPRMLPKIEIMVTGQNGRVTRYKLGTSDRPLQPGGRFDFSSRLEAPKDGVKTVSVTFSEDSADAGRQGQGH